MADINDVLDAFATLIQATVYPNGTAQPSITGNGVKIHAGWPISEDLDADLGASSPIAHISIIDRPEERDTSAQGLGWAELTPAAPRIIATASRAGAGSQIVIGGSIQAGDVVGVTVGVMAPRSVGYGVSSGDSLNGVAAALASLLNPIVAASSTGSVVTLPTEPNVIARIGGTGSAIRQVSRQNKLFQITVWAPDNGTRKTLAAALEAAFSANYRRVLVDWTMATIRRHQSFNVDEQQKRLIYERHLMFFAEYSTTQVISATTVVAPVINVTLEIDS